MKRFFLGFAACAVVVVLLVLYMMLEGTPFRSMLIKTGIENGRGIIYTERFVVVYEGMAGDDANATNMTYAGRHGEIPAFWRGYQTGWSGGATGIDTLQTYDPGLATATVVFHGKIVRVEEDGTFLRTQLLRLPLGPSQVVVLVNKDGDARELRGAEAQALLQTLQPWYRDPQPGTRPPVAIVSNSR
jgi:hypothetical protein